MKPGWAAFQKEQNRRKKKAPDWDSACRPMPGDLWDDRSVRRSLHEQGSAWTAALTHRRSRFAPCTDDVCGARGGARSGAARRLCDAARGEMQSEQAVWPSVLSCLLLAECPVGAVVDVEMRISRDIAEVSCERTVAFLVKCENARNGNRTRREPQRPN